MKTTTFLQLIFITLIILTASGCLDNNDEENHAPVADAGDDQNVQLIEGKTTVHFSASGSHDKNGDDLTYIWDFDDSDGINDVDSTELTPTKHYFKTGDYTVTLHVSDGKLTSSDSLLVSVTKEPGEVTAVLTSEEELNGVAHEEETYSITFSGEDSSTKEGEITDYDWDFNYTSDGFNVDESGEEVTHEFESGKFVVALRVTNDTGETGFDTAIVKVNYNQTYSKEMETGGEDEYPLPLNSDESYYMRIYLVSNNSEYDARDLDLYLYYPNGTEANNTSDVDQGKEEIYYSRDNNYSERLEATGEWTVKVKHEGYNSFDNYDLYLDVVYHS